MCKLAQALMHGTGKIPEGPSLVCTPTGQGLKDLDTAIAQSTAPPIAIQAELESVKRTVLDNMTG